METKEFEFKGVAMNGFVALFIEIAIIALSICGIVCSPSESSFTFILAIVGLVLAIFLPIGFRKLEPNEAMVMLFFGTYKGTFTKTGFYWVNFLMTSKKVSLRARNLNPDNIKVNDKTGNPIMIGQILVWKLKDTYKAMFEIDSQTMAGGSSTAPVSVSSRMRAFESFIQVQSDAALREVAGMYAYDETDGHTEELTLRSGGKEINDVLLAKLNERLTMSGLEVVEARINYLAYSPEIAAVMLRRQQAAAIISAREKIVDGAVSMVKMALDKLKDENVVDLDEERKAAMVSNLLVVLCADESAQPVLNTGSLY